MKRTAIIGLSIILISLVAAVCTSCKKDDELREKEDEVLKSPHIKMTTLRAPGEKMGFTIYAEEADRNGVWIDLNNNGKQDKGEKVTTFSTERRISFTEYTVDSQTITLHGKVTIFDCGNNDITALNVSRNTFLTVLYCKGNDLSVLDLSKNTALQSLGCMFNDITALNVSKNTALIALVCGYNNLTALDVSKNRALDVLHCECNKIKSAEMTKLVEGLPSAPVNTKGYYFRPAYRIGSLHSSDNEFLESHKAIVKAKNWILQG